MAERQKYTATIINKGDYWIGWVENMPGINCQEDSREEIKESIVNCIQEYREIEKRDVVYASEDIETFSVEI